MGYDTRGVRISGLQTYAQYGVRTSVSMTATRQNVHVRGRKLESEVAKRCSRTTYHKRSSDKTHFQAGASMALKNMFGCGELESRKTLHKIGLGTG